MQMLHFCVLLVSAGAAALWANSIYMLHRLHRGGFWELHHEYYGALLVLAPASWGWVALVCWLVGLYVMLDDSYQHERQIWDPRYLSPLHRCYAWAVTLLSHWTLL